MWKKLKLENRVHKTQGVLEKQPHCISRSSLGKIDRLFSDSPSELRPVYQPCVFWTFSHPTMISCLSLGPMVTGEIWRAGPERNDWPREGCQVGIVFHNKRLSLSPALWQGCALAHRLLRTESPVYKRIAHQPLSPVESLGPDPCSLQNSTAQGRGAVRLLG